MNNLTFSDYFYEISSTSYDGEKKLINLGQGNPHINIEKEALQLLKRLIDNPKSHIYPQASDENILRESLMKRYNSLYNINITTKDITIVSGAKKAFYLICNSLLDDSSKVLLIDPAYPDYQRAILNFTQNIYKLDANNRLPNVSDIEEMVKSKGINVIIFNYPNNPTGTIANTDFWERIHNLSKIYNLKIINDFTYSDYVYTDTSSSMFSSLNKVSNDYMYEIYSFSKNFTIPGWRIAAIICSQRNIEKINFLNNIMESGIFTPMIITLNQMILSNQKRVKVSLYHKKAKLLCKKIQTLTNWECSVPDSGMFLWIKLKNINSWEFFKEKMENENLIILPGILYGKKYINYIRLSLNFNLNEIDEIITRLVNGEKYDEIS